MKKMHTHAWALALAICMSLSFASCSDDDEPNYAITLSESTSTILPAEGTPGVYSFDVQAEGDWTVSVVSEETDWIYLITRAGKDKGTVTYAIDNNYEGLARTATVRVSNKQDSADYVLRQGPTDSNAASDVNYKYSGLGHGVMMTKSGSSASASASSLIKNTSYIFNWSNMADPLIANIGTLVSATPSKSQSITLTNMKEYTSSSRDIKASLTLDISFGLFKFGLSGSFKMYGAEVDSNRVFQAVATCPLQELSVDYYDVVEKYLNPEGEMTQDISDKRGKIFSSTFLNRHDKIEDRIAQGAGLDDKTLQKYLKNLDAYTGPLFIESAMTGGYVDIDFCAKETEAVDTMAISGKLNASFSSLFSLKVEASADYMNTMNELMSGSELNISVTGGSQTARTELIKTLGSLVNDGSTREDIIDAISTWSNSLNDSTAATTSITVAPVWQLFSIEAEDIVKEYFLTKYSDTTTTYTYDLQQIANY